MKKSQKIALVAVVAGAIGFAGFNVWQNGFTPQKIIKSSGTALIGGDFTLINQDGKTVTNKDFEGKYMLIYFGYTFCPDVCPTELQVMTGALEKLGDQAKLIQPVFVSVDPQRDKPEIMKDYVSNFFPGMIGLTGTPEQISRVAKLYRVYYSKAAEKGAAPDEYAMDHSSIVYLMGPDGSFVKHFSYGTDADKLAQGLKTAIKG
jgi:protein SCO1/2